MMQVVFSVGRRVDLSESELCVAFASIVYESRNKSGVMTYGHEFIRNETVRVRWLLSKHEIATQLKEI